MSGSRVARTRPELVATWCDGNAGLVAALDDAIAHLPEARDALAADGVDPPARRAPGTGADGLGAPPRSSRWSSPPTPGELRAHGRGGGWVTAVLRDGTACGCSACAPLG